MALDWDDILSYNTVKVVRIRDRRLGILHITFMASIVIYIVIYSIILNKGYLNLETPVGSIRASLLKPSQSQTNFPYCSNQANPNPNILPLKCEYWDESNVVYPIGEETAFCATTRVKYYNQTADCEFTSPTCTYKDSDNAQNIYVADIERFTLLIDHTMYAPVSGIQRNALSLHGYIQDENNKEIQVNQGINTIGVQGKPDIIELGLLLNYTGINLDNPSLINPNLTMRYDGLIILVFIDYSNTYSNSIKNIKYTYSTSVVQDTEFTVVEPVVLDNINHRFVFKRHGIRMLFFQTGSIGHFKFQSLLLTFVSGMGLLAISTLIVDQLAIRILPQRKSYQSFKFQVTEGYNPMKKIVKDDRGDELLYHKIESL
ncbi:hypothetical protein CYY_007586 [Polysphondylium violaceum]|uniref:P2X receptor n=1 Tax=Polysphondylium violaceum TaxID=133409 RepID=A0A8J4UXM0_9MYCE|nr:hypothetical protein CYY_007586 [Polysphondylium violaceum]